MLINANNTLPVITGIRPEPTLRQSTTKPRLQPGPENQANLVTANSDQGYRRPPLFLQPMSDVKLSRTGEEAMRTYRDVAMAGDEAELVNRVNVLA